MTTPPDPLRWCSGRPVPGGRSIFGPCLFASVYAAGALAIVAAAPIWNDDPYITFRYAANLARGAGFVYNPGERVAGITTPLLALALAPFLAVGLPLRAAVGALALLAYGLMGWGSWRLLRPVAGSWAAPALALLLLFHPGLLSLYGNETALAVGLALAALACFHAGRWRTALLLAAALAGVRPDAALLGVVLVLAGWQEDRRRLLRALPWAIGAFLPFYLAFVLYYGHLAPHTLAVKAAQGATGVAPFWKGTMQWWGAALAGPGLLPIGALAWIGLVLMARRRFAPLPLFVLFYGLALILIDPPFFYYWYQWPYWLLLLAAAAWGLGWLTAPERLPSPGWRRRGRHAAAMLLLSAALGAQLWQGRADLTRHRDRSLVYERAAAAAGRLGAPADGILLEEIGIIGWRLRDWRVIDMAGLVHLRPWTELLAEAPPRFAVLRGAHASWTPPGSAIRYEQVETFTEPGFACTLLRRAAP